MKFSAFVILGIGVFYYSKKRLTKKLTEMPPESVPGPEGLLLDVVDSFKFPVVLLVVVYFGAFFLPLPYHVMEFFGRVVIVSLIVQVTFWCNLAVAVWFRLKIDETRPLRDNAILSAYAPLQFLIRLVLWGFGFLVILDNLGVNITALVAGLGIGGIAVAMAVQNILGDIFCSVSIVLDKPFEVGDFIVVDNYMGEVERIGIKTTRIKSVAGEQIVFSNADLLGTRIRNYRHMTERRVKFSIGVVYQTPPEKLEAIPGMVREIVGKQDQTRFDRAHFFKYGDSSLDFEVVYYVATGDYTRYMDVQQKINLEIFRRFREESIEFAYPSRTVFMMNEKQGRLP